MIFYSYRPSQRVSFTFKRLERYPFRNSLNLL